MVQELLNFKKQSVYPSLGKRKASILIIALWSIILLSVFAVTLAYNTRQKANLVNRIAKRAQLRFIAEAAVKKAIVELGKIEDKEYDSLGDDWSDNVDAFKERAVGGGKFNISYRYFDSVSKAFKYKYGLCDEESKININTATMVVIKRILRIVLGADEIRAQKIAAAIVDWRDSDSALSTPTGSAEDFYYEGLKNSYEAKDAKFESLDELLLVKGIDRQVFEKIKDYITVHSDGKININTASAQVFLALGLSRSTVEGIFLFRNGIDAISGTGDDNVFYTLKGLTSKLSEIFELNSLEKVRIETLVDQNFSVSSHNFLANIEAISDNNNIKSTTQCVITKDGNILYWQEL